MLCSCGQKDEIKTIFMFYIYLVVVYGLMYSHEDMNVNKLRIATTTHFIKGGKCETFKGVNFVVY